MSDNGNLLRGLLLGAGAMYLLDPDRGPRRRAVLGDQLVQLLHQSSDGMGTAARDLRNRAQGAVAEAGGKLRGGPVDDRVLEARVRSALGRLTSHPGAIEVTATDGQVTLSGPVLANEVETVLSGVRKVNGVSAVEDRMKAYDDPADVPALQGQGRAGPPRPELMQENWAPATRLVMGALGGAMALRGMRAQGPLGAVIALGGLGMLARALTNLELARLTGATPDRRAVEIQKMINVDAPVDEVWAFWSNYENFPRFMSHLREVRMTGERTSHWVAELNAGVPVEWDAETTAWVPNEVIGWKSIGSSPIRNAGLVKFLPNPDGSTRLDIRISYNPPAGALGHAVARFLGSDPKQLMDDDLVRFKSLLEHGKATAHGHTATRDELAAGAATHR